MPLRLGVGGGVPFAEGGASWSPALAGWKNYGDLSSVAQTPLLHPNNDYTGVISDATAVQSIEAGTYGSRGLKETSITGPTYYESVSVGSYSGPALYFGGNRRLLADASGFDDFGSHSVMLVGAFRTGPTAGAIWTKGFNADARGTVEINTNEFRIFNTVDIGTGQFVSGTYSMEILEYTYDHAANNHKLWLGGSIVYNGSGPGQEGGRAWCLGKGSGGFVSADFYCMKWAMKGNVMSESERLGQRAYWGF